METNLAVVQRIASKYGIRNVMQSTRKDKKYMVADPTGKMVHFGQKGYSDFTGHKDPVRRANFQRRNAKWKTAPKWSPSWLSYHLLW
jgi:hypothetical protein